MIDIKAKPLAVWIVCHTKMNSPLEMSWNVLSKQSFKWCIHIQGKISIIHELCQKYDGENGKTHTKIAIYKHFNKTCMLLMDCIKWSERAVLGQIEESCHHEFIVFIAHMFWPNVSIIPSIHKKFYGQYTKQMDSIYEVRKKIELNLMLLHAGCVLGNVFFLWEKPTCVACEPHFQFW